MLLKRILTASIIAPIVVFSVLLLTQTGFAFVLALILIISSWEYCNLIQIKHLAGKALSALIILLAAYFLSNAPSNLTILYVAASWWLVALIWVSIFPKGSRLLRKNLLVKLVNGLFIFVPMAIALMALHLLDPMLVLFLLILIWAADIGAYFAGKFFGKNNCLSFAGLILPLVSVVPSC